MHDDYYTQRRVELDARDEQARYAAYEIANTIAGAVSLTVLFAFGWLLITVMV